ncbi:hypothetical protein CspHIS471_0301220 [Cutaneotrichosporon sp. HIS471]|nr:hypothetical protein CspHIS471_0301220 [Cutaneotrichosporon sp. HIS471]
MIAPFSPIDLTIVDAEAVYRNAKLYPASTRDSVNTQLDAIRKLSSDATCANPASTTRIVGLSEYWKGGGFEAEWDPVLTKRAKMLAQSLLATSSLQPARTLELDLKQPCSGPRIHCRYTSPSTDYTLSEAGIKMRFLEYKKHNRPQQSFKSSILLRQQRPESVVVRMNGTGVEDVLPGWDLLFPFPMETVRRLVIVTDPTKPAPNYVKTDTFVVPPSTMEVVQIYKSSEYPRWSERYVGGGRWASTYMYDFLAGSVRQINLTLVDPPEIFNNVYTNPHDPNLQLLVQLQRILALDDNNVSMLSLLD